MRLSILLNGTYANATKIAMLHITVAKSINIGMKIRKQWYFRTLCFIAAQMLKQLLHLISSPTPSKFLP